MGKKSPDGRIGYRTRTQTDLLASELQTGSQPNFRKGANCGAQPARRDVPHIEKCSPIRSTNLHIHLAMTMNGPDRSKKIVTI